MKALSNGELLLDEGFVRGRTLLVEGERIAAILPDGDPRCASAREHRDLAGALVLPGFIDVQVNGGGGALFNDAPTVETIATIGAAHRRFGTSGFLPTLISDEPAVVARAIDAVREAMAAKVPGVLGIHVEGPFINREKRGTHDAQRIRALEAADLGMLASLGAGRTVVTVAPETLAPGMVRRLAEKGLSVCAGHTNATYDEMRAALAEGVRGVTHLFNAMSPLATRSPGAAAAALLDPECWCGLIVDGRHVHPAMLQLALRAKRAERFMLVTDAMPAVGTDRRGFMLQGKPVRVVDGACVDEAGVLSGSALDMASAVRNAVDLLGVPLAAAARMASANPAEFLGLAHELGHLRAGYRASFVIADRGLRVQETWINGERPA